MPSPDQLIHCLAVTQHGVITRTQARSSGLSEQQVRYRFRTQGWSSLGPGAFLVPSASSETDPTLSPLMAACLTLSGLASHRSAAWLWGIITRPGLKPEVTVSRQRYHRRPGVTVYSSTQIDLADVTTVRSIPTTGVERTLIDMATLVQTVQLEALVDRAVKLELTDQARLQQVGQAHSQRGRPGVARIRQVLGDAA